MKSDPAFGKIAIGLIRIGSKLLAVEDSLLEDVGSGQNRIDLSQEPEIRMERPEGV